MRKKVKTKTFRKTQELYSFITIVIVYVIGDNETGYERMIYDFAVMIILNINISVLAYFLWETLAEIIFLGATQKLRHTSLVQIQPLLFSGPVLYCFFHKASMDISATYMGRERSLN